MQTEGSHNGRSLTHPGFLAGLPDSVLQAVLALSLPTSYRAGEVILRPGTTLRTGIVQEGQVRSFMEGPDGRQVSIRYARLGESIGLPCLYTDTSPVSLVAATDSAVLLFDKERFLTLSAAEPSLANAVATELSVRLIALSDAFQLHVFGTVRQRLARHILSLAASDGEGQMVAKLTHQDLADAVGSVREVVARAMGELRAMGAVSTVQGHVVVMDETILRRQISTG